MQLSTPMRLLSGLLAVTLVVGLATPIAIFHAEGPPGDGGDLSTAGSVPTFSSADYDLRLLTEELSEVFDPETEEQLLLPIRVGLSDFAGGEGTDAVDSAMASPHDLVIVDPLSTLFGSPLAAGVAWFVTAAVLSDLLASGTELQAQGRLRISEALSALVILLAIAGPEVGGFLSLCGLSNIGLVPFLFLCQPALAFFYQGFIGEGNFGASAPVFGRALALIYLLTFAQLALGFPAAGTPGVFLTPFFNPAAAFTSVVLWQLVGATLFFGAAVGMIGVWDYPDRTAEVESATNGPAAFLTNIAPLLKLTGLGIWFAYSIAAYGLHAPYQSLGQGTDDEDAGAFCQRICVAATDRSASGDDSSVWLIGADIPLDQGDLQLSDDLDWAQRIRGIPNGHRDLDVALGDLNEDGYLDLAIGVPGDDSGTVLNAAGVTSDEAGAVYIIYGPLRGGTLAELVSERYVGERPGQLFGGGVTIADVNADGAPDLIATARRFVTASNNTRGAVLFFLSTPAAAAPEEPVEQPEQPAALGGALPVGAGGQFLFWSSGPSSASAWFNALTIAWLFNPDTVTWTSYVPPLGRTDFLLEDGAVLWLVSPIDQALTRDGDAIAADGIAADAEA